MGATYIYTTNEHPSDPANVHQKPSYNPVIPPATPVAAIRASTSADVSQAILVPGLFTSGSAAQTVPPAHGVSTNDPDTHCANDVPMQASSPTVHDELAVSVLNCAFSFCASSPFWAWNPVADGAAAAAIVEGASVEDADGSQSESKSEF